jgi:hypothetical protein
MQHAPQGRCHTPPRAQLLRAVRGRPTGPSRRAHAAVLRVPEEHRAAEPNREHVAGAPVHQVHVEVVRQLGRVQDLRRPTAPRGAAWMMPAGGRAARARIAKRADLVRRARDPALRPHPHRAVGDRRQRREGRAVPARLGPRLREPEHAAPGHAPAHPLRRRTSGSPVTQRAQLLTQRVRTARGGSAHSSAPPASARPAGSGWR